MRTAIITSADALFALREAWTALHRRVHGNLTMSFEWLHTWWTVYGTQFQCRALTGWEGERLIGLFPCFRESYRLPHIEASRMRFLGEYSIFGEYSPLIEEGSTEPFARAAADFCLDALESRFCDFIDFHAFPSTSSFMREWLRCMGERRVVVAHRERVVPRLRITLPADIDAHFASMHASERKNMRRKERALLRLGARFVSVTDPGDRRAFEEYVALHTNLWVRKGTGGYFATRDRFSDFHAEVTRRFMAEGKARLYFLEHEGHRFVAMQVFRMYDVVTGYLGGRDHTYPLMHLSPGNVLTTYAIKEAIRDGAAEYDFLTGDQPFKRRLGGIQHGWHSRASLTLRSIRGAKGRLFLLGLGLDERLGHSSLGWITSGLTGLSRRLRSGGSHEEHE